jgi:hypothetical protein
MLQARDLISHFNVTTLSGERFAYSEIWQRKNLVLILLPQSDPAASTKYVSQLMSQISELTGDHNAFVITRDRVAGLPSPGVVIADRWGEIQYVARAAGDGDLPSPQELIEWLQYVQSQCPECQGESE